LKQDKRPYTADYIEGKFSNIGQSYEAGELMLLFAGIYFTRLDTSGDDIKKRCLVQVSSMIQFNESVYQAIEFQRGKILVSLWEAGYCIVDKISGLGLMQIIDPMPANVNCRGFEKIIDYDIEHLPFIIARNSQAINLINVRTGFCQTLI
jgi:hypothetical protein